MDYLPAEPKGIPLGIQFSSVQFSHSVMSDFLRPHEFAACQASLSISGKKISKQRRGLEPQHWGWKEENIYSRENKLMEIMLKIFGSWLFLVPLGRVDFDYKAPGWWTWCILANELPGCGGSTLKIVQSVSGSDLISSNFRNTMGEFSHVITSRFIYALPFPFLSHFKDFWNIYFTIF